MDVFVLSSLWSLVVEHAPYWYIIVQDYENRTANGSLVFRPGNLHLGLWCLFPAPALSEQPWAHMLSLLLTETLSCKGTEKQWLDLSAWLSVYLAIAKGLEGF